jgi:hypothetical protein
MPRAKKPAAAGAGADPNKLLRRLAGTYRTSDERFEVRQAGIGWFLVDSSVTDELGQELVRGPFPTLIAVREALPDARRTTLKSLPRPKAARPAAKPPDRPKAVTAPPSWIDELPKAEAAAVRRLIKALTLEGITDADQLVRADRQGQQPSIVEKLLEHRLDALVDELQEDERDAARRLVQRVVELLSVNGTAQFDPLPGWSLVEIGPAPEPANRRIVLRRPPKRH